MHYNCDLTFSLESLTLTTVWNDRVWLSMWLEQVADQTFYYLLDFQIYIPPANTIK